MKKNLSVLSAVVLVLAMAGCSVSRTAVQSEADAVIAAQIDGMLADRLYKVDFTRAYPVTGPSLNLTYPYFISVIGDRVESFLPYAGRVFSIPYGGGEGLRFTGPITEYTRKEGRKGRHEISFVVRTDEDLYDFSLTVWPTGESNLSVSSMKKQNISFSGNIDFDPEFEAVRTE